MTASWIVRLLFAGWTLVLLPGCVGIVADSIAKSWNTGSKFSDIAPSLASIPDGFGRLYIYRTKDSTKTSLMYGIGFVKNPTLVTVDGMAHEMLWETFKYFDLAEGSYPVSAGYDILQKRVRGQKGPKYRLGTNVTEIQVTRGMEIFVRVDLNEARDNFHPSLVDAEVGRKEIANLREQEKSGHTYPGGKLEPQNLD